MLSEHLNASIFSETEIKKHCARIIIDGYAIEANDGVVPSIAECLQAENGLRIVETYLTKGYPRQYFSRCSLPRDSNDFLRAFAISDRSKIKLYGNILGFSVFFGNLPITVLLLESMHDTLGKTHFVMTEDSSLISDEELKANISYDNIADYAKNDNERWTMLEVALAAPNGGALELIENRLNTDTQKIILRQQLRLEKNTLQSPLSKMVRYFIDTQRIDKIAIIARLLNEIGSPVSFAEHFSDIVFDAIRKRSLPPSKLALIPGLNKNMADRNQNSWSLYLDAFISDQDRPEYEKLFTK